MKKNYLIWLIGGAALYFLTRKKTSTSTDETSADTPSSDVGNQANDKPNTPASTPANAPANVIQPAAPNQMAPNSAPAPVTPPGSPRINPIVLDIRANGTAPQTPQSQTKGYSIY